MKKIVFLTMMAFGLTSSASTNIFPIAWMSKYFPSEPCIWNMDNDNDGWDNLYEFYAGTDPRAANTISATGDAVCETPKVNLGIDLSYCGTLHKVLSVEDRFNINIRPVRINQIGEYPPSVSKEINLPVSIEEKSHMIRLSDAGYAGISIINLPVNGGIIPGSMSIELSNKNGGAFTNFITDVRSPKLQSQGSLVGLRGSNIGDVDYKSGKISLNKAVLFSLSNKFLSDTNLRYGASFVNVKWREAKVRWSNAISFGVEFNKSIDGIDFVISVCESPQTPKSIFGCAVSSLSYGDNIIAVELSDTNPSLDRVDISSAINILNECATNLAGKTSAESNSILNAYQNTVLSKCCNRFNFGVDYIDKRLIFAPSTPRYISSGINNPIRVFRTHINNYTDLRNVFFTKLVLDTKMDLDENGYLTEANMLANGLDEIDFGTIWPDWDSAAEFFEDITNVTYRIVIGDGTTDPLELNNDIGVAFVNAFEWGINQTPAVLGDVVLSGSQPTFIWSHTNSINKAYPLFQLRIWEKDGTTLVFDSGKVRAPARDANGEYKWTAPVYDGMMTAEGKTFFTASNYVWSVSMLDAKFSEPLDYEFGYTTPATFRLGGTSAAGGLADYGLIPVAVKYMGTNTVSVTPTNLVHLCASKNKYMFSNAAGKGYVSNPSSISTGSQASIKVLKGSKYYVYAFIDQNADGIYNVGEPMGYYNNNDLGFFYPLPVAPNGNTIEIEIVDYR